MRISDWSSDVCSSDLLRTSRHKGQVAAAIFQAAATPKAVIYPWYASYPGRSSSPGNGAAAHSWAQPSDNQRQVPIWRDIDPVSCYSASSSDASASSASSRLQGSQYSQA